MKKTLLLLLLGSLPYLASAQPSSGGPGPSTPPVTPTETPLDGGASLLLAGGIGYAVRRLRQRRRVAAA